MNKCKICNSEVTIIPPSYILQDLGKVKDFWCPRCQRYYTKEEIVTETFYITLCPYCREHLSDCKYKHCIHCGKELKDPLIKEIT